MCSDYLSYFKVCAGVSVCSYCSLRGSVEVGRGNSLAFSLSICVCTHISTLVFIVVFPIVIYHVFSFCKNHEGQECTWVTRITRKLCAGGGHSAHHACVTPIPDFKINPSIPVPFVCSLLAAGYIIG